MKAKYCIFPVLFLIIFPFQLAAQLPVGVATPASQEACSATLLVEIVLSTSNGMDATTTYAWTRDNTVNVFSPSTSGTGNIVDILFNNTTSTQLVTYTIIPTSVPEGEGDPFYATVTLYPSVLVYNPGDLVVCNTDAVEVNFSSPIIEGLTTYQWVNDNTSIGLAGSGSGDISFTAVNAGTSPQVATISVTPFNTINGVTCEGPPEIFTITVNPTAHVDDPADLELCHLESTNPILFTSQNTPGVSTYSWTNDNPFIGLASSGTGDIASFTAMNIGPVPEVATITVTPQFTYDGQSCDGPSETFTITVHPEVIMDPPPDQMVCHNDPIFVHFTTPMTGGTISYTWTNDRPEISIPSSGSGDIFGVAINPIPEPIVATFTVTPHYTNGGISCAGMPETFTITVNPEAQVDMPVSQIVCNMENTAEVVFTTDRIGGITTYEWTNDTPAIGLAASGTGNISSFAAVNAGTSPLVATLTVTPLYTYLGLPCYGPAETFTITVNPTAQVDDPADQVVCNNENTAPVIFTTNRSGGTTTFTWTNDTPGIGLAASGIGDIPSFAAVNPGSAPVTATITVTPRFTYDGHICDGPAETFTITVNPTAQVNPLADQVLCNASSTATVAFTSDRTGGTATYSWTNDTPAIGLAASGNGDIPSFTTFNSGTAPLVATITVTPFFTNDGHSCAGPSEVFSITVNPDAQVDDPADQVLCHSEGTAAVVFTTDRTGGTVTYAWTNDTPGIGLAASGSGDIPSFVAVNTGTAPVTATITVTPVFSNGGETCVGITEDFNITVNPTAQVYDPPDQVVCNTQATDPVNFTTNRTGGTTTYSWTNDTPSIGLAANGTDDIASFAAVNTGLGPLMATITVTPHYTFGGQTCDGLPEQFTITVNPTAQVNDPSDQVLCSADLVTQSFSTNNIGGTNTFSWVNDSPGVGLAASGSGDISFTAVNTGTSPVVATIIVTPQFSYSSAICSGPAETFTLTVNPAAQVNDPADQTVYNGENTAAVSFGTDRTGGTTTYTWTNDTPSIGLAATGSGDIPSFAGTNLSMAPVTATITVTPHFTNGGVTCDGPPESFTITVEDGVPLANAGPDQEMCASLSLTLEGNDPISGDGLWTQVSGPGTMVFADESLYNTTASTSTYGSYVLRWSITYEGSTNSDDVEIMLNEDPVQLFAGDDQVVCGALTTTLSALAHGYQGGTPPAASTRLWSYVSGPDMLPVFGDENSPTSTVTVSTAGTYVFQWTESNGNCMRMDVVSVEFSALPQVNGGADQEVCFGESVTLSATGEGTLSWDQGVLNGTAFTPVDTREYHVSALLGNGCTDTDTVLVTVNPLPDVDAGTDQEICFGEAVTLTASGATSYAWDNGVSNGVAFVPTATANYTVTGTDDNGCSRQDQVLVEVKPIPQTPTIILDSDTLYSDSETGNQWYLDGSLIPDATDSLHVPTASGVYHVVVTEDGCASEKSNEINVRITALIQNEAGKLKIYPNPAETFIKIETESVGPYLLRITSASGQMILQEEVSDPVYRVDLTGMLPGMYFVTISSENWLSTSKLVKR